MAIKSLEDLKKIRDNSQNKVSLRETGQDTEGTIEVMIGLATCGIASGARETMNAIVTQLEAEQIKNVRVVRVGCLGFCHSEPTVQVNVPGQEPVLYGNVDEAKGREIVTKHIKNGDILKDSILIQSYQKA